MSTYVEAPWDSIIERADSVAEYLGARKLLGGSLPLQSTLVFGMVEGSPYLLDTSFSPAVVVAGCQPEASGWWSQDMTTAMEFAMSPGEIAFYEAQGMYLL